MSKSWHNLDQIRADLEHQAQTAQPTDRPGINQLTSDMLDQLYDRLDAVQADRDGWCDRALGYRLATKRVRALHSRWEYDANNCSVCVDCYGAPLPYPCPTIAALDQDGQTTV